MNPKEAEYITKQIIDMYPNANGSLNYNTTFELLVALILAAQCTDERVNKVTKDLFKIYNTPKEFANADLEKLENLIHSCGFYRTKAKHLIEAGQYLEENFNGKVPDKMEELVKIPGIGRKSANIILTEGFNKTLGIAVDTHVKRISTRLGFSKEKEPVKIEQDLLKLIPEKYWEDVNHKFIEFGRNVCMAKNPKCEICKLQKYCLKYNGKLS